MSWIAENFLLLMVCSAFALLAISPFVTNIEEHETRGNKKQECEPFFFEEKPETPMTLCFYGVVTLVGLALFVLIIVFWSDILNWIHEHGMAFPLG